MTLADTDTDTAADACALLDADHLAVKHLFVAYARLAMSPHPEATAPRRTDLAMQICDALSVHAQVEEELFYPALRAACPDAAALVDKAEKEHQRAKQLIADIRGLGAADPAMDTLVAELGAAIELHVKGERDDLFPRAKAAPELDIAPLAAQMAQRQQALTAAPA